MNIWILTTEFPPYFGGGIGTYCIETAKMFSQYNHKVTIIMPDEQISKLIEITDSEVYKLVRFKPGHGEIYSWLGYHAALSYQFADVVAQLINENGAPDFLESQDYLAISYYILKRKLNNDPVFKDVPVIITLHMPHFISDEYEHVLTFKFPEYWLGEMEKFCILAADLNISPSKFLADTISEVLDGRLNNVTVIPNPYEPDYPEQNQLLNPDIQKAVYLGRMQHKKGLSDLIENLKTLWDDGNLFELTIIGGDSYFPTKKLMYKDMLVKRYPKYFKEGKIRVEGLLSRSKMFEFLNGSLLIFVPSLFDNLPYTVLESMALGKIVVTTTQGGQSEVVIDRVNGFLYNPYEKSSFKSTMDYIFNLTVDELQQISNNAIYRINSYVSYQSVYYRKIDLIETLLATYHRKTIYPFIDNKLGSASIPSSNEYKTQDNFLSVIIPYFNMGEWIEETLDSLMNIDYADYEVIIVNDGSDDTFSNSILLELGKKYPISVIDKPNGGLSSARNFGAIHAKGEFLAFVDADDKVDPRYFNEAISVLKMYENVSYVGSWAQYFEGSNNVWPAWNPEPPYILIHNSVVGGGLVYKRKDFLSVGMNDTTMVYGMEDYESTLNMLENGYRGVVIDKPYYWYRIRQNSMARQFNFVSQNYLLKLISRKHVALYSLYSYEIFNILNNNGPAYLYDNPTWSFPTVGYLEERTNQIIEYATYSTELPVQLKDLLKTMWKNKLFRLSVKTFLKLKFHKIFIKEENNETKI